MRLAFLSRSLREIMCLPEVWIDFGAACLQSIAILGVMNGFQRICGWIGAADE